MKKKRVDFHLQNAYNICQTQQLLNTYDSGKEVSTIQEIATMIEKSKRRFLCIKFRACGLSFSEGIVLLVIGYSRYSNQETISSLSGIDKYQTAKVLAAMEERGYIRREINPENKREKLVCLSEKGKEAANSLKDIMDQWEKIIFAGITPQEEQVLEQIMGKIVGNVREYERNIGREKL